MFLQWFVTRADAHPITYCLTRNFFFLIWQEDSYAAWPALWPNWPQPSCVWVFVLVTWVCITWSLRQKRKTKLQENNSLSMWVDWDRHALVRNNGLLHSKNDLIPPSSRDSHALFRASISEHCDGQLQPIRYVVFFLLYSPFPYYLFVWSADIIKLNCWHGNASFWVGM